MSFKADKIGAAKDHSALVGLIRQAEACLARHEAAAALGVTEQGVQALTGVPLDEPARRLLARLYTLQSCALTALGERDRAWQTVAQALTLWPDDVDALIQRGRLYRDEGETEAALRDLDQALTLDERSASAYLARGMVRERVGDSAGALADYGRAAALDDRLALAWSKRARLLAARGETAAAECDFTTALRLDPHLLEPYTYLAYLIRQKGDLRGALQIVELGLRHHPGEPELLLQQAYTLVDLEELSTALVAVEGLLRVYPDHAGALALRGQIHGRSGNLEAALADLGRAVALDPGDAETHFNYALANLHARRPTEAFAALLRALQLEPGDQEAQQWRTRLAGQLGLEPWDRAARVLERFAYSHCGPGRDWKVEIRQMHTFHPNGEIETYNAAVLDPGPRSALLLVVKLTSDGYCVEVMAELAVPDAPRTPFTVVAERVVPQDPDRLLAQLNLLVTEGVLRCTDRRLQLGTPA